MQKHKVGLSPHHASPQNSENCQKKRRRKGEDKEMKNEIIEKFKNS